MLMSTSFLRLFKNIFLREFLKQPLKRCPINIPPMPFFVNKKIDFFVKKVATHLQRLNLFYSLIPSLQSILGSLLLVFSYFFQFFFCLLSCSSDCSVRHNLMLISNIFLNLCNSSLSFLTFPNSTLS